MVLAENQMSKLKCEAHRGFPARYVIYIMPLDPAYKARLAGHVPAKSMTND